MISLIKTNDGQTTWIVQWMIVHWENEIDGKWTIFLRTK